MSDSYKVEFIVGSGEGDRYLRTYLKSTKKLSIKALRRLKIHDAVFVNGKTALLKSIIQEGDRVVLEYPPEKVSPYIVAEDIPINVVYEDEDIMVLDKQAGLCVHPNRRYPRGTLANGVLFYWGKSQKKINPHFVNRLDKDTSGLILVAKSRYGAQQFFEQQRERNISRSYQALVKGEIYPEMDTIDLPIGRADEDTTKRKVSPSGQVSITNYKTLEKLSGYSLLDVQLDTGRTHQIRVHLSHLGFPILGDYLYGGESTLLKRQFLHAYKLKFYHPVQEKMIEFTSELPDDLLAVLAEIRRQD